jgi:hypothetical protein
MFEGAPSNIIVVDIKFEGNKFSFSMPKSSYFDAQFKGEIDKVKLKGMFIFKDGHTWEINLPRKASYWN